MFFDPPVVSSLSTPPPLSVLGPDILIITVFTHPQYMFFPQDERPSYSPMENNKQHDSFAYLYLYVFRCYMRNEFIWNE